MADPADPTSTGLTRADVAELSTAEMVSLAEWMGTKAGDDNGRRWWPHAVRRMPVTDRLALALDAEHDASWDLAQRKAVERDPIYFTLGFGHVQPGEGPALPFILWPEQREALESFHRELRTVVLKARQLGLTWLALHYAVWLLAFNPATPNAQVLALSKHGGDATHLLGRARRICQLLPPFLRPREDAETRQSKSELKLEGRGKMRSLAGTPAAARGETATLAILDEFAHITNRGAEPTWTAVQATLGQAGKAIIIFTGNGPAEAPGNGQAAARLWNMASAAQASDGDRLHPIFLPSETDRSRDAAWRERTKRDFLSVEDFQSEYPQTEIEALAGRSETKVYSLAGISAAARLGARYDMLLDSGRVLKPGERPPDDGDMLPPPADNGKTEGHLLLGGDYGLGQTAIVPGWPLEVGGLYIPPLETMEARGEPTDIIRKALDRARDEIQDKTPGPDPWPLIHQMRFDAAGGQSNKAAMKWASMHRVEQFAWDARRRRHVARSLGVPFGASAEGRGAKSYKELGVNYLRRLFERTAQGHETQVIAISPRNVVLLRQLRGLEFTDDDQGKILKRDDHGPDALIALVVKIAIAYLSATTDEGE